MSSKSLWTFVWMGILVAQCCGATETSSRQQAEAIIGQTGFSGGLVVHLGCGSGQLTAALAGDGRHVVHGLGSDAQQVAEARRHIASQGLYGRVSVMNWTAASLPYVDHLVNLIVAEQPGNVSEAEMLRVLVPGGVAYVKDGAAWSKLVKPARPDVDEWTHYLYDATGNPVSRDKRVGPPRHLQWNAGPAHTRSHEYTSSIAAIVSSGGRVFYIADEGPTGNLQGAADWQVVARDAHNGLPLWRHAIDDWYTHLAGWTSVPIQLQRRLVAAGNRVFVTLGYHAPVTALDASSGDVVQVFQHTEGADEILWHKGVLLVAAKAVTDQQLAEFTRLQQQARRRGGPLHDRETGQPLISAFKKTENRAGRWIVALDAETGQLLWKLEGDQAAGLRALSLQACEDHVYFHRQGSLVCLDLMSGERRWSKNIDAARATSPNAIVCWNKNAVTLLSPRDGGERWTQRPVLVSVRDAFITADSVWIGGFKPYDTGRKHTGAAWGPYFAVQRDLRSGEIVREVAPENPGHHQRCYVSKATERFILGGRRGTEFIDLQSGEVRWNSWARGVCRYGVMPANGLLYTPPHSCGCYITAKLTGFNALASERVPPADQDAARIPRLEPGPALGQSGPSPSADDWPTYRGNARRSGITNCRVPLDLQPNWQVSIGGRLTAPTVAGNRVYVARTDQHTLLALDVGSGHQAWTFVTDARIDSPPTIHQGRALLGCRDGFVYSLQVADGSLAWRFRGARDRQRISSYGQLESAWPIHGSVLVDEDVAYFTAGRSSYLDGGIDLYRLDPISGRTLSVTNIYSPDPKTKQQPAQYNANQMPGSRNDILVADASHIYFRDLPFSKDGQQLFNRVPHLFTLTDFLDDSWTHRSYWVFAAEPSLSTGCSGRTKGLIYGRLLLYDDATVYGYARKNVHWSNEFQDGNYHLYARGREATEPTWSATIPIQVRAMVRAGQTLLIAGPDAEMVGQTEPADGRQGALLLAYSATDGKQLGRYELSAPPVFDGMAVARGKLFLTLADGSILCMGSQ